MDDPLTQSDGLESERERRFVDAYLGAANCVAETAAKMAGYADTTARAEAHLILRRPHVLAALKARTEGDALVMGRQERLERLTRHARGEARAVVLVEGMPVEVTPTIAEQQRAIVELGKVDGDYIDRSEVTLNVDLSKLTDEQLLAFTAGKVSK